MKPTTQPVGPFLRVLLSILVLLLVSACRQVEVLDYVHEPTHQLRQSLIITHEEYEIPEDEELVLVPNFRTFTTSYSAPYSSLIFLSQQPTSLHVETLSLRNVATGFLAEIDLNETYSSKEPLEGTDYQVGFLPLFKEEQIDYEGLRGAEKLELTMTFTQDEGSTREEQFTLTLVRLTKTAWST